MCSESNAQGKIVTSIYGAEWRGGIKNKYFGDGYAASGSF